MKHARVGLLALLAACGEARPVVLPAAPVELLVPVDDHSALVFISGARRDGWLARVDRDGRPLWVRPLPEFMATVRGHAAEATRIVADDAHGALRLTEFAESGDPTDHWLGFSLRDGTPLWHQHLGHAGEVWADRGHLFRRRAGADGDVLEVRDLVTGAFGFTHDLSRPPGDDTRPVIAAFADAIALPDASRGVVLRRASDGLLRASFAIRGDFCRIGDTIVGLRDDDLVGHDPTALRSPPRVLARGLAEVLPGWLDKKLVACHVRGDDTVLEFGDGVLSYLVTLGPGGPARMGEVMTTTTPGRQLGASVPSIRDDALVLRSLTGHFADDARRIEPMIHAVAYDELASFDGGYLASHASDDGLDLLSLDLDGTITGAARILGRPLVTLAQRRGDQLWLVDRQTHGATLGLRVLALPGLRPLGGAAFTIVDRTAEARAAWLPPPPPRYSAEAIRSIRGPDDGQIDPPLFAPGAAPPTSTHAAVTAAVAVARAQGVHDPLELLAWDDDAALFVAHGVDAEGPRWTFVAVDEHKGDWADAFRAEGYPQGGTVLRRRPTRTDVELRLRALRWALYPAPGYDWHERPYRVDLRRYVGLTFASPRRPVMPGR